MLALILTRKLRPIAIGSDFGVVDVAGMIARPRATSSRTNSGVTWSGMDAPKSSPSRSSASRAASRPRFSRIATYSISGVTMPRLRIVHLRHVRARTRAQDALAHIEGRAQRRRCGRGRACRTPLSSGRTSRWATSSTSPRRADPVAAELGQAGHDVDALRRDRCKGRWCRRGRPAARRDDGSRSTARIATRIPLRPST